MHSMRQRSVRLLTDPEIGRTGVARRGLRAQSKASDAVRKGLRLCHSEGRIQRSQLCARVALPHPHTTAEAGRTENRDQRPEFDDKRTEA